MDRMRCTFITHGLPETVSQTAFDEASAALSELCALFKVEQHEAKPAPVVGGGGLPSTRMRCASGCLAGSGTSLSPTAASVRHSQGEVIRIAGRVGYEFYDNGGINLDRSFEALLDQ